MIFDHDHPLYQSDSEIERQIHMDENKTRSDLGYPVARLHRPRSTFEQHEFVRSQNPRIRSCLFCGRSPDHPIHDLNAAA